MKELKKEYNICGIYKIINIQNNYTYIGSSKNVRLRIYKHFWELKNNRHSNEHLQNAYNKYGKDSFDWELVCSCDLDKQYETEQYYIDTLHPEYNIKPTADGTQFFSEETKQKMSKKMKQMYEEGYVFGVKYNFPVYVYDIVTWSFIGEYSRPSLAYNAIYKNDHVPVLIDRINKRIIKDRFIVLNKKFEEKLELINFVNEHALTYWTNDARLEYLIIIKDGYYHYAHSIIDALKIIGKGSYATLKHKVPNLTESPILYKDCYILKSKKFLPIIKADLNEESLSLLTGKIEEHPEMLDNIEITYETKEA